MLFGTKISQIVSVCHEIGTCVCVLSIFNFLYGSGETKNSISDFIKHLVLDFVLFVWNPERWRRCVADLGGGLGTLRYDSGHDFAPKSREKKSTKTLMWNSLFPPFFKEKYLFGN